tara:strand:- start:24968 stop:26419 length:1452 start_codon:yes stop_codon:yes gene_type:complete
MRTYEELTGAEGRRMFYRAERYKPSALFSEIPPSALLGGKKAVLKNLSITGAAFQSTSTDGWDELIGKEVPFELRVGEDHLYSGSGLIRRIDPHNSRPTVAVEFTSGFLDIPAMVTDHDNLLLAHALANPAFATSEGILPEFVQLCTEIVNTFRSYKEVLESFEARLTVTGEERERKLLEALIACEDRIVPQWKELWYRGSDILEPVWSDPKMLAAHKRYAERVLTPDFMPGAVMKRCYEKPLGYPGDYQIMNYVYEWQRVGNTPYEKLLHRIGIETGACVGTRLRMTQDILRERIAREPGDTPLNIANLGCGSAYEIYDYLKIDRLPRPVNVTLIDQDQGALSHAYENAYREVVRHAGRAKLQCFQASFAQLLKAGALFKTLPPQDVIYSLGLFDYLSHRRARALAHDLYAQVAPGGKLIIANVKTGRETCQWPLEFVTDWSLVYRTEQDMRDMFEGLDIQNVQVVEDSTKCVFMIMGDKPA